MKMTNFLQTIKQYPKPFYRLVDLEKIFDQDRVTINKSVERLIKQGWLQRLTKDVYVTGDEYQLERVATEIYKPSYVSLESVLYEYGVINQAPYGVTLVTTRRTKKMTLGAAECWYAQIKPELWWGFEERNGVMRAELEKAVVEMIYLRGRGQRLFETDEWYWGPVDRGKLKKYLRAAGLKNEQIGTDFG